MILSSLICNKYCLPPKVLKSAPLKVKKIIRLERIVLNGRIDARDPDNPQRLFRDRDSSLSATSVVLSIYYTLMVL